MQKICLVGAPSTGKTTLAQAVAFHLQEQGHKVELVKEFARDFISVHGSIQDPFWQLAIAWGQKERERQAKEKAPDFIICDASIFLPHIYLSVLKDFTLKGRIEDAKFLLAEEEIRKITKEDIHSYDFVFFLPPELKPEEDGVRIYLENIDEISARIKNFLISQKIPFYEVRGTVEQRLKAVLNYVQG